LDDRVSRLLTVAEVGDYLQLNPRTVLKMAQTGELPAVKIARQWRFRPELLERWLDSQMALMPTQSAEATEAADIELSDVLYTSPGLLSISAGNRLAALREIVARLVEEKKIAGVEPFLHMLYEREAMLSTGIGNGVAIPHARRVLGGFFPEPMVALARSADGIDWSSVDGVPVHLILVLAAPTDATHLRLLSRISRLLHVPEMMPRVLEAQTADQVAAAIGEIEHALTTAKADGVR
jgi:PTS system nitrogen regulatory IIA component